MRRTLGSATSLPANSDPIRLSILAAESFMSDSFHVSQWFRRSARRRRKTSSRIAPCRPARFRRRRGEREPCRSRTPRHSFPMSLTVAPGILDEIPFQRERDLVTELDEIADRVVGQDLIAAMGVHQPIPFTKQ